MRTVRSSSGATAVQIVYSSRRGSREIEHLGSAHRKRDSIEAHLTIVFAALAVSPLARVR